MGSWIGSDSTAVSIDGPGLQEKFGDDGRLLSQSMTIRSMHSKNLTLRANIQCQSVWYKSPVLYKRVFTNATQLKTAAPWLVLQRLTWLCTVRIIRAALERP